MSKQCFTLCSVRRFTKFVSVKMIWYYILDRDFIENGNLIKIKFENDKQKIEYNKLFW